MNYKLVDAVAQNRLHPRTFEIPSVEEIRTIRAGDFVKLGFFTGHPHIRVERMWVRVTASRRCVGVLDNTPVVNQHLKCGDVVQYAYKNVLGIISAKT